jgi:hypothetical protein
LGRAEGKKRREGGRPRAGLRRERGSGPGQLGRIVKEEKKKGWAGWAGLQGKRKEKKKRKSGPGPIRKRGRKRIAFKCIRI